MCLRFDLSFHGSAPDLSCWRDVCRPGAVYGCIGARRRLSPPPRVLSDSLRNKARRPLPSLSRARKALALALLGVARSADAAAVAEATATLPALLRALAPDAADGATPAARRPFAGGAGGRQAQRAHVKLLVDARAASGMKLRPPVPSSQGKAARRRARRARRGRARAARRRLRPRRRDRRRRRARRDVARARRLTLTPPSSGARRGASSRMTR